jgi:hypothetical protein
VLKQSYTNNLKKKGDNMNSLISNDENPNFYDIDFNPAEKKITELSRQLKTYLNYRKSTILAICRGTENSLDINNIKSIQKWELEIYESYLIYISFLNENIGSIVDIKIKVLLLAKKAFSFPNSPEVTAFKNFLKCKIRLWELLHILSGLEIHTRPQSLKRILQILTNLCNDESKLNENIPEFYQQLRLNYRQLQQEYEQLLLMKENKETKNINIIEKVRVR